MEKEPSELFCQEGNISVENVKKSIIEAFAHTPPPADNNISSETYDDEGTSAFFKGKTWQVLSVNELKKHSSSLTFFTAEAFRYYLPAFMLAEIENPLEADVIGQNILSHFSPPGQDDFWKPIYEERLSRFSQPERVAIANFVVFYGKTYSYPKKEIEMILTNLCKHEPL